MAKRKSKPHIPLLIPGEPEARELSLKEARDMLGEKPELSDSELADLLKQVRLVAVGSKPALYIDDPRAPYVRVFARLENEKGLGKCPKCGKWFVQKRTNQVYDSIAHRESHRVIRWRTQEAVKKKSLSDTVFTMQRFFLLPRYT